MNFFTFGPTKFKATYQECGFIFNPFDLRTICRKKLHYKRVELFKDVPCQMLVALDNYNTHNAEWSVHGTCCKKCINAGFCSCNRCVKGPWTYLMYNREQYKQVQTIFKNE